MWLQMLKQYIWDTENDYWDGNSNCDQGRISTYKYFNRWGIEQSCKCMPWDQHSGTSTPIVINKYQLGICSEHSVLSLVKHIFLCIETWLPCTLKPSTGQCLYTQRDVFYQTMYSLLNIFLVDTCWSQLMYLFHYADPMACTDNFNIIIQTNFFSTFYVILQYKFRIISFWMILGCYTISLVK